MRTRTNLLLVATAASLTINSSSIYSAGDDSSQYTVQRRTTIDESRRSIGLNEARVGEGRSRRRRRSTRRRDEDHYQSSLSKRRSLEEANSEFYDLDSLSEDEKRRLVEVTVAIMDSASIDWDGLEENFINTVISDRSRRSQQTRRSLHSGDTEKHEKDDESDNILQQNKRAEQRFKLRQQQLRQQHHQRGRGRGRGRGKGGKSSKGKSSKGKSSKSHSSKSSKSHSSKSSTSKSHSKSCGSHSKSGKGSNDCPESVTASPTTSPSQEPSYQPTPAGTASNAGTPQPTLSPTPQPTPTPAPTAVPTQPQPGLPETQLPSQLPTQPPTPFNNTNWFNYTYDEGNCPNAGTFGVPCYNNTKGRISEICDKYNRDFGSFRSCMDACAPSFCCIHDALPPPEDGPSTGTNFIAPHCNLDENCPQYTYCYIVWWKLHDTIGPALYLRLSQDDQFFDIEEEDIQEDQTGSELFTQVLLHHFDDVAQVISAGTVDGEFSAKNIFDDSTWWESTV